MARDILKSNNSIVIAGERPAFSTTDRTGDAMSGAFMSTVQNVSLGFSMERQKLKQIGSNGLPVDHINRSPNVNLSIDYYYSPSMLNEQLLGLTTGATFAGEQSESGSYGKFLSGYDNQDQNFYILNRDNQGADFIEGSTTMLSGLQAGDDDIELLAVGNAFLTNYSLSFEVGQLPVASTSYLASNLSVQNLTGSAQITNPAINLQSGNANGAGLVDLEEASTIDARTFSDDTECNINRLSPPLCSPTELNLTLKNLQIGGAPISGDAHIQSFGFNVPFRRVDMHGLGSNYPYARDVQFPLNCSASLNLLVSGFLTGEISGLVSSESSYDFDVEVVSVEDDPSGDPYKHTFSFEDLKLESSSYSMPVNGQMGYSLDFSFEVD